METTSKNYIDELDESGNKILSIFCVDTLEVKARVTFDSSVVEGIQFTFWMDEDGDVIERVNRMFDTLFEEVAKDSVKNG